MRSPASFILYVALLAALCHAYPSGAPESACFTMVPGHRDTTAQKGEAPYTITVTEASGGIYDVTLKANHGAFPFKGFMVNAVGVDSNPPDPVSLPKESITGEFVALSDLETAQGIQCVNTDDTATHTSNKIKFEQQLQWRPTKSGKVQFRATFVVEYPTYFVGVTSDPITVSV